MDRAERGMPRKDWKSLYRNALTTTQLKILGCLADGTFPKDVHEKLGISESSVYENIRKICGRLGVENYLQAIDIYRPAPSIIAKLNRAEALLREVLFDKKVANTYAQPRLLQCLDELGRARQILRVLE